MPDKNLERSKEIMRYNMAGVIMNLVLALFKIIFGLLVHAHAVMLDGFNSLSDMVSMVISIMTTFIGRLRRSDEHPFGYGRAEYLSSLAVTLIILYVGFRSIIETINSIIHPHDPPSYNATVVIIMVVSLLCKLGYGILMRRAGRRLGADGMVMTGTASLGDALTSAAILAGIVFYKITGIDIEHYLCIGVSIMVIRTGFEMLRSSITKILGTRIDPELRRNLLSMAAQMKDVLGVSNLILHNYGEGIYIGSLDIEVDEDLTARQISKLSRMIIRNADAMGVSITSVGINGTNTKDPAVSELLDRIYGIAMDYKGVRSIHAFTVDQEEKMMSFYLVPDYSVKKYWLDTDAFIRRVRSTWPEMYIDIHLATDL